MSNMILVSPEFVDSATISGSSSLGNMQISNLKVMSLAEKWRTSSDTPEILIDLGEERSCDFVSLIAHNSSGTATISAGNTILADDFVETDVDMISGEDIGYSLNAMAHTFDAQTYRYWKITIDNSENEDGYFEAGRVYVGKKFKPSTNIDYGLQEGLTDGSRIARSRAGAVSPVARDPYKISGFTLSFGTKDEMFGTLYEIDRNRGKSKDVIFIPDMDETTHFQRRFMYGLFEEMNPIINTTFNIYQKEYRIKELT